MENVKIHPNLEKYYNQLKAEGFKVYTFVGHNVNTPFIKTLKWYENGRVLSLEIDYFGHMNISHNYIPSKTNGSGCRLGEEKEEFNFDLLRKTGAWVNGFVNYNSMDDFLKREKILTWYEV
jgi:hypothetical protein